MVFLRSTSNAGAVELRRFTRTSADFSLGGSSLKKKVLRPPHNHRIASFTRRHNAMIVANVSAMSSGT